MSRMMGIEPKALGHSDCTRKRKQKLITDENVFHLTADNDLTTFNPLKHENKKKKECTGGEGRGDSYRR
jgi:hypothetical protein